MPADANLTVSTKDGLTIWWGFLAVLAGLCIAILIGRETGEGCGEIAGVMFASTIASGRAFWAYRVKNWYYPLLVGWSFIHVAALLFFIIYIHPAEARIYISLIWVEYLCFAGLVVFFTRLWGDLPDSEAD